MKPLFLVLAKLTGLLHLYWTVALVLQMAMMFSTIGSMGSMETGAKVIALLAALLYSLLAGWIAWILLVRTEWLAGKLGILEAVAVEIPAPATLLLVGVQLIGIYVAVNAVPALVRAVIALLPISAHMTPLHVASNLLSPLILLILGLALAFRAPRVVALISRRNAAVESK